MTDLVHVKPAEGGTVFHPETGQQIPVEGVHIRKTTQVRRYLSRGDLVLIDPEPKSKPAKSAKE